MKLNILFFIITLIILYFLFFKNLISLFLLFVFSTPYTALSLININGVSISFPIYVGIFLIIKFILICLKNKKIKKVKINIFLFLFIIICLLSCISPMLISSKFRVTSNLSNEFLFYQDIEKIKPMLSHILYILYCYAVYVISKYIIKNFNIKIKMILEVFKKSFYLVIIFCLLEIIFYKLGLSKEFNNILKMNESALIQGYGKFLRISGPNLEPSMFSIYLLFSFGIFYFNKFIKESILVIIFGILSTSTSFILGIFMYIFYFIVLRPKEDLKKILFLILILILSLLILITIYPQMFGLFEEILHKINGKGVSGGDRKYNMLQHFKVSISINPISGIGYGIARSKDLLTTWLCNIGYFGVALFSLALITSTLKKINKNRRYIGITLIIIFLIESISVPEPYFLYIWCFWGILDSDINDYEVRKEIKNADKLY